MTRMRRLKTMALAGRAKLATTLAIAAATIAGVLVAVALPASAATAAFAVVNNWGSGYQGQFTVTNNTSAQTTSWRVEFDLPSGANLYQSWGGQRTTSGSHHTVVNESWNGTLAPGASTTFGFLVNGSGFPTNCTVNGGSCGGGGTPTTTTSRPPTTTTSRPPTTDD